MKPVNVETLPFPHLLYQIRTRTTVFEVRCMFISRICINVEGMKNKKSQNSCAQEGEGGGLVLGEVPQEDSTVFADRHDHLLVGRKSQSSDG